MRIREGFEKRLIVHGFFLVVDLAILSASHIIQLFFVRRIGNFHMGCNIGKIGNDQKSDLKNSLHEGLKDTFAPLRSKLL